MTQRRASRRIRALLAAGCLAICGTGLALAADQTVLIEDLTFTPANVTIQVGDTVTWRNDDAVSHTATADDGSFDTGTLSTGQSGAVTFDTAGTFAYHCTIHPQMTGSVVVEAAGPAPTDTPAPTDAPAPTGTGQATQPPTDTDDAMGPTGASSTGGLILLLAAVAGLAALWSSLILERRRSP